MANPSERHRNNLRAGIFVSVALITALIVVVVLSGVWTTLTRTTEDYTVRFEVSSGVANLKRGAEVRVGGLALGRVESVEPSVAPGQAFEDILVRFNLHDAIELFGDAKILVSSPLLGSDAWLDIPHVGHPATPMPDDGVIPGATSAGMLTTMLGPANADRADAIIENAERFSAYLGELPETVDPIVQDVGAVVHDLREERWPHWAGSVDEIMTWATSFTASIDGGIADARAFIGDGRDILAENRDALRTSMSNVETTSEDVKVIAERVRTETLDKANALLDNGRLAIDDARAALDRIRTDYDGWSERLGDTFANASLASQQLKLATIEVRRSPWKLLYRPSPTELEHELLYDAARSFALASADLKAASASVKAILDEHGDVLGQDDALLERVQRNLTGPLENYERAQQRLLDVLFTDE